MDFGVIIAAAGAGRRMGGNIAKQYLKLDGVPVLARSVMAFCGISGLKQMVVSCPKGDEALVKDLLEDALGPLSALGFQLDIVPGGERRQDSVALALDQLRLDLPCVLVHDGARPFVSPEVINGVLDALSKGNAAVIPGVQPKNTIRTAQETLDRSTLYEVQTPQGFYSQQLREAYIRAEADGFEATDDASLTERLGIKTFLSKGDYANIKITTPEDLPKEASMRIGTGYDVHRLVEGRKLMLGGVEIPYEKGLLGHSDADVIAHAICDALLGAAALGDIGKIFPDNSPETEGMAGRTILAETAKIVRNAGFTIVNVDATLVAEKPKVSPYTMAMREAVAEAIGVDISRVSIKATTEEKLGFTGNGSAMAAQAVALIE